MTAYPYVIAIAVAALVLALGLLLMLLVQREARGRMAGRVLEKEHGPRDEWGRGTRSVATLLLVRLGQALERRMDAEGEHRRLLAQAGWRGPAARGRWYWLRGSLPLAVLIALLMAELLLPAGMGRDILLWGLLAFILSVLAPPRLLRLLAARRRERIRDEVPLFIHLLVLLFEAGLSTRQALVTVARDGRGVLPELGGEWELAVRQIEAGAHTGDVLESIGQALQVQELTGVLTMLRQVERYGGEIRESLLEALAVLEERRALALREKVNELSGRMTVAMVLFFFPALLIFVAGPAFMSILRALGEAASG